MFQRTLILTVSSVLMVGALVACKKSDKPQPSADKAVPAASPAGGSAAAAAPAPAAAPTPANDDPSAPKYDKPALTEAKIQSYIKSANDGHNMFEAAGAAMGALNGSGSITDMKSIADEQEAVAKKYGFASYADYMDTAGRIMLGETQLGAAEMMQAAHDMQVQSIASIEKQLADPALAADTKAELTESLADAKKSLADLDAGGKDQLNATDLALVKKFKVDIEAAEKAGAAKAKK